MRKGIGIWEKGDAFRLGGRMIDRRFELRRAEEKLNFHYESRFGRIRIKRHGIGNERLLIRGI